MLAEGIMVAAKEGLKKVASEALKAGGKNVPNFKIPESGKVLIKEFPKPEARKVPDFKKGPEVKADGKGEALSEGFDSAKKAKESGADVPKEMERGSEYNPVETESSKGPRI